MEIFELINCSLVRQIFTFNFFNLRMRILSLCFLALIQVSAQADESVQVYYSEGELNYIGNLDENANRRLFSLYEGLEIKPTTLAIRSRGGDVVPAWRWVNGFMLTKWQ